LEVLEDHCYEYPDENHPYDESVGKEEKAREDIISAAHWFNYLIIIIK
jgi:hypothetical protein